MGNFGGFYKGEKKKKKKTYLDERARKEMQKKSYSPPSVEILRPGKNQG